MPKPINVQIGPYLPQVKVNPLPARDDALYKAKRDITYLKNEVSRLQSKIRRMAEDLEYEITGWKAALETGRRQESHEAIKRRISRLRGAIDCHGVVNFDEIDDLKDR